MGEAAGPRKSEEVSGGSIEPQEQVPAVAPAPLTVPQQVPQPQVPVQPQVQISPERIQKLQELLAQLIIDSTDLGLALGALDCPHAEKCPLVRASREIAKSLLEIRKLTKR
jgi:hypothetical protein